MLDFSVVISPGCGKRGVGDIKVDAIHSNLDEVLLQRLQTSSSASLQL